MPVAAPATRRESLGAVLPGLPRGALLLVAVGVLATALFALLFGAPGVTGDVVYHLVWGRELAHGTLETFAPGPTPHPLVLAAATATSVLGTQASYDVTWFLWGPAALGATLAALVCLASQLGNRWTAVLAAVTLAVDVPVLSWAAFAQYDIAFGALILWALAAHLGRPGRPVAPLVLLAFAGLIRPEAWLLAGLYWLWLARKLSWRGRILTAAIVGAAPACWMAIDAAVMGDFMYSFHYTETASRELTDRYTRSEHALRSAADLALVGGALTLPAALLLLVRRDVLRRPALRPVLALLGFSLASFALLLVDGLPNQRYLIVPGYLLIVLAALAATPNGVAGPRVAVVAAGLLAAQAIVFSPAPLRVPDRLEPAVDGVTDVKTLLARPEVEQMFDSCQDITLTSLRQTWSYWSGRKLGAFSESDRPGWRPDVYIVPASQESADWLLTRHLYDDDASFTVPAGMRRGPAAGAWQLYLNPESACVARAAA
jgi:hypothetical protein